MSVGTYPPKAAGAALTGAHRQTSYTPPTGPADLPLPVVGITRGVVEPAGGAVVPNLPAGIQAGDLIFIHVSGGGNNPGPALTNAQGFPAFSSASSNAGTQGATNAATYLIQEHTYKAAAGGGADVAPTITWPAAARGGNWTCIVLRPAAGATYTLRATVSSSTTGGLTLPGAPPGGANGTSRLQHYFGIIDWMGSAVNTADPTANTLAVDTDETADPAFPAAILAPASAIGVRSFIFGGWAMQTPSPVGNMTWAANQALTQIIVQVEETGGASEPTTDTTTPQAGGAGKGPWAQLIAATTFSAKAIRLLFDARGQFAVSGNEAWFADIAIGGAGAEQVVIADIDVRPMPSGTSPPNLYSVEVTLPVAIPAGSRVAVRQLHRATGATIRSLGVHATLMD